MGQYVNILTQRYDIVTQADYRWRADNSDQAD